MASRSDALRTVPGSGETTTFEQRLFRLGMTITRVGFGLVFLTNGIAKVGD